MTIDWDDAFANSAYIAGADALPAQWMAEAEAYRASGVRVDCDVPYGGTPREKFDLIWPDGVPVGLAVFVHGGYWMMTDKSMWTAYAEGARARGWAVCLPSYTLAPDARISQITRQIGVAINCAAGMVAGPIRLAGHSAGGHLVSRMNCVDSPLAPDVQARVAHTLSISGVHDLRPLMQTKMNATLRLDKAEALAESPTLAKGANVTAWVGGDERPEFIRQAKLLSGAHLHLDPAHNHFSVLEGLKDPKSDITNAFVG